MRRFRKKPVEIEAVQWGGGNMGQVAALSRSAKILHSNGLLVIHTIEPCGDMKANLNDWVIRGVQGELYPCKPDIFAATYEPADEPEARLAVLAVPDPHVRRRCRDLLRRLERLSTWLRNG
jgi:hypothetical protein